MTLKTIITSILLAASAYGGAPPTSEEAANAQRNLNQYERAGPYLVTQNIRVTQDGALIQASIRDFLWRHWRERRLGWLRVINYTMEGAPVRTDYFVEPDSQGHWRVQLNLKITLFSSKPNEPLNELQTSVAYTLARVEPGLRLSQGRKAIPRDKLCDPKSYDLILKDRDGTTIDEL